MRKAYVIVGANYGDEGKGLMTDYLASQSPNSIVVRHNGGSQAGHTVVTPDGIRHVFSHIGSGAFTGADTYLAEEFICNPITFYKEFQELESKYPDLPKTGIFVNGHCRVTTPFDMLVNQIIETRRGPDRHGSVGIGIGQTVERSMNCVKLVVGDLMDRSPTELWDILAKIRDYSIDLLGACTSPEEGDMYKHLMDDNIISNFLVDCDFFLNNTAFRSDAFLEDYDNIVFESGQGLMLDEEFGFSPHVTWSNCGIKNVIPILDNVHGIDEVEVIYMTRHYVTRHGAGPLPNEISRLSFEVVDETNLPHEFQGVLRLAPINLREVYLRTREDFNKLIIWKCRAQVKTPDIIFSRMVTCLDQFEGCDGPAVLIREDVSRFDTFVSFKKELLEWSKYSSYGPTRDDVVCHAFNKFINP